MRKLVAETLLAAGAGLTLTFLLLAESPFRYAGGFLLVLALLYVFVRHPFPFLAALLLLRPMLDSYLISVRFAVGGVDIGLGGLVAAGLAVGSLFYVVLDPARFPRLLQPMAGWYLFFFLVNCVALLYTQDRVEGLKILSRYASVFSVLVLVLLHADNKERARGLVKAMLFSLVPVLGWGVAAYVREGGRLSGTFGHPNILAYFLIIQIGILFFQLDRTGIAVRFSARRAAAIIALVVALALTQTRSGWGAFLAMAGVYALCFNRKWLLPLGLIVALAASTPLIKQHALQAVRVYGDAVVVNEQSSLGWRVETWRELWKMAVKRPFAGHGLNADHDFIEGGLGAHNDYLRYFTETGIVGVIAYFGAYLFLLTHAAFSLLRSYPASWPYRFSGFFICFVPAFLLMSTTENLASYITVHWYVWVLIGLYSAVALREAEPAAEEEEVRYAALSAA